MRLSGGFSFGCLMCFFAIGLAIPHSKEGSTPSNPPEMGSELLFVTDSLEVKSDSLQQDSVGVKREQAIIRHNFRHREQVIVGFVVMVCIALVMVTMNNYNPK